MRKCFYVLLIFFLFLSIGCIRSKITPYPTAVYEATSAEEVEVYQIYQAVPPVPFEVIGEIEIRGAQAASWDRMEGRLKREAAKIGGDAVISLSRGTASELVGIYAPSPYFAYPMRVHPKYFFGVVIKWNSEDKTPTSTSLKNLSGTWVGAIQENYAGKGTFKATISQYGSSLIGTWSSSFSDATYDNAGELTGTFVNELFTATLTPNSSGSCSFTVAGALSGNRLVATYKSFNCSVEIKGIFDLNKID